MEKKFSLILDKEFIDYCKLNNIEDVEKFAREVFIKGFNITKYGIKTFIPKPIKIDTLPTENIPDIVIKPKEKIKNNNLYDE